MRPSFSRIYKAASPAEAEVRAALQRLSACVRDGKLSASDAAVISDALFSKL